MQNAHKVQRTEPETEFLSGVSYYIFVLYSIVSLGAHLHGEL